MWIPLAGIALVLVARAISPVNRTPMCLVGCGLAILVLAIRAAMLNRSAKRVS